ncbi:MBL fold metallo-hydrolase, partial [Klebsiella pneumoniae]|nr:MBL fold metallo-hydrolase [Klebsiella pneumoniae]
MEQLQIGDIKVTWLKGGNTHLDGGAMFGVVPKVLWSRKY